MTSIGQSYSGDKGIVLAKKFQKKPNEVKRGELSALANEWVKYHVLNSWSSCEKLK